MRQAQRPSPVGSVRGSDAHVDVGADVHLSDVDFEDATPWDASVRKAVDIGLQPEVIDDHLRSRQGRSTQSEETSWIAQKLFRAVEADRDLAGASKFGLERVNCHRHRVHP